MTWTWIQGSISRAQKKCKCCQHTDIATCPSCPINLFFFFPFFELIHINEFKKLLTHTEPIWNVAWLGKMSTELKKNCSQDFSIMHNEFNFFLSKCMQLTALGKNILLSSHWCYFTCMSQYKPVWDEPLVPLHKAFSPKGCHSAAINNLRAKHTAPLWCPGKLMIAKCLSDK